MGLTREDLYSKELVSGVLRALSFPEPTYKEKCVTFNKSRQALYKLHDKEWKKKTAHTESLHPGTKFPLHLAKKRQVNASLEKPICAYRIAMVGQTDSQVDAG